MWGLSVSQGAARMRRAAVCGAAAAGLAACGAPEPSDVSIHWPMSAVGPDRVQISLDLQPVGVLAPGCSLTLRQPAGAYVVAGAWPKGFAPYPIQLFGGETRHLEFTPDGRLVPAAEAPADPVCEVLE